MKESKTLKDFMALMHERNPNEPEFLQAVHEVAVTLIPFIEENPKYKEAKILERMTEPERVIMFRVPWVDDKGEIHINRGFRVQMNSAIGPYKGGLRFHPTVNLSVLKFLAFEQVLKNSLTTLPLGGGKGGCNFDPKGKSEMEIMRFCQSFMTELGRHTGPTKDIPAGDIGVGGREIGYLYGQYKRINNEFTGVLTGKGLEFGGSMIRSEATGYGVVYFANEALKARGQGLEGSLCAVSGSGNVAQFTIEKLLQFGAKPVTISDSLGMVHDPDGIDEEKLETVKYIKNIKRGRIKEYTEKYKSASFHPNVTPWNVKVDYAFPSATQNELPEKDAQTLVDNGCKGVFEGANMPSTEEATEVFLKNRIIFGPGKAANAGGVATSGLEMSQDAMHMIWTREEVEKKLSEIMVSIHKNCEEHGRVDADFVDYVKGANVAGFVKVANAMIAQGAV